MSRVPSVPAPKRDDLEELLKKSKEAVDLARERGYGDISFDEDGTDMAHLDSMYHRMENEDFSEGKLGRWLGYAQGVLVAHQCCTLEEMKELNKAFAG